MQPKLAINFVLTLNYVYFQGLDYEKDRERRLEIVVNNEAPYDLTSNVRGLSMNTATVVVKIRDQDEGPVFEPCEYILHIKECLPRGTVVGNYQARDPETENSEGMRYTFLSCVNLISR